MALVAIRAVVYVPTHLRMLEVRGIIVAVAGRALEHRIVIGVRVARRAHIVRLAVVGGELRVLRMVEGGTSPCSRVVAGLASSREELRLRRMARVRRVVVIGLMAADAGSRQRSVVVVDVAVGAYARRHRVRASQRECRVVVVER